MNKNNSLLKIKFIVPHFYKIEILLSSRVLKKYIQDVRANILKLFPLQRIHLIYFLIVAHVSLIIHPS